MTTVRLGRSTVDITRFGLGCAPIGNLFRTIPDDRARATVDAAWDTGIRYFDTAPHYGLGLAERRLGEALRHRARGEFVVSTKVGRVLEPDPDGAGRLDDEGFVVPADHRRVWDFSAAGVRRSVADSLARLGLDRVDVVLVHDPEDHLGPALDQAYPALAELRAQGVVGAIGVGSKRADVLRRFVVEVEPDVVLVAGRYTLLEQPALDDLLPACAERGVTALLAGVFNSGLLAAERPHAGLTYEYARVPADVLARAERVAAVCARHAVSLPRAALAFAAAYPGAAVLVGAESPEQVRRNAALLAADPPPAALWADLVEAGLLRPDAPVPVG
jgi:D-threo-aldose 1-dehydrogenase